MNNDFTKVGNLIAQVRKERNLTQAQFAKKLGTSQSAVNRIESGRQNLSMDMLARISEVLNKEIVSLNTGTVNFRINGGKELKGEITTKVSKNATVAILAASLLNKGTTKLLNVPRIEEVFRLLEVLESIGVAVRWIGHDLELKPPKKLKIDQINAKAARRTRSVLMFIGPLVHHFKEFSLPYAGGCKLGSRTVGPHLQALEAFGVDIVASKGKYLIKYRQKKPGEIVMAEMSDTASENAIMAASLTPGKTTIKFVSHNYMVRDLCFFLQKLGVKIEGIGTSTLVITGKSEINKRVTYSPSEDPIESMAFIAIAAVTDSSFTIKRCPIDFLELELYKLKRMGWQYKILKKYKADNGETNLVDIKALKSPKGLRALEDKIHSLPYPGINMDNLPFFAPIAATAKGRTMIHDWSYENRAIYHTELNKLDANVEMVDPHRLYITGPTRWRAAEVVCPPALRPAVVILIGMLAAPGCSVLRNVYSINRGYEDLANRLNQLGADVTVIRDI